MEKRKREFLRFEGLDDGVAIGAGEGGEGDSRTPSDDARRHSRMDCCRRRSRETNRGTNKKTERNRGTKCMYTV